MLLVATILLTSFEAKPLALAGADDVLLVDSRSPLARGSGTESFETVAGSSYYLIARIGFNLTSEIGLITALRLCNPQLLDIAIG